MEGEEGMRTEGTAKHREGRKRWGKGKDRHMNKNTWNIHTGMQKAQVWDGAVGHPVQLPDDTITPYRT